MNKNKELVKIVEDQQKNIEDVKRKYYTYQEVKKKAKKYKDISTKLQQEN